MPNLNTVGQADIGRRIATRYGEHLRVLSAMDNEINGLLKRHNGNLRASSACPAVVCFLFGKSLKSIDAAKLLAGRGYGEDALILLRTVLESLFSAAYISDGDSEERAQDWIADGYCEQVAFIKRFPEEALPPWIERWNPEEAAVRAARWPNIKKRATEGGLTDLYDKRYSFLCSLAHSDAWSSGTYVDDSEGFRVATEPSIKHVDIALLAAAELLPPLTECFCRAFHIVADEQSILRRLGKSLSEIIKADRRLN